MSIERQYIRQLNENKNKISLEKELNSIYKGTGWTEWDSFKEDLAMTNFDPKGMSDEDLEKLINASGIAKVKKVQDIKNYSDLEGFDPNDFNANDKIIISKSS